jgi:hypothetical protein
MPTLLGRQMSSSGVVHLVEEKPGKKTWLTVCGRKIQVAHALPLQNFTSDNCCSVCKQMQRSHKDIQFPGNLTAQVRKVS